MLSKKTFNIIFNITIYLFACIGALSIASFIYIKIHGTNVPGFVDSQSRYLATPQANADQNNQQSGQKVPIAPEPTWATGPEWQTLKAAVTKDAPSILKASTDTGVNARYITAALIVEQLRLYHSNRELFKQVFSPLQILGVQSQFSWGVMGMKQDTAIQIENNLKNSSSPFYLGPTYEHILDFTTSDQNTERFNRLTDQHNHYYSYLYTALYMKEVMKQWQNAGYDISKKPGIVATLFNIGFTHSQPNPNPNLGGAEIDINGITYSFGGLAFEFYYSPELRDVLPR